MFLVCLLSFGLCHGYFLNWFAPPLRAIGKLCSVTMALSGDLLYYCFDNNANCLLRKHMAQTFKACFLEKQEKNQNVIRGQF